MRIKVDAVPAIAKIDEANPADTQSDVAGALSVRANIKLKRKEKTPDARWRLTNHINQPQI